MTLIVGHNCPGCGLDTPEVACAACGAPVVWDRESGSHCSACGEIAWTITCRECGREANLDPRQADHLFRSAAVPQRLAESDDEDDPHVSAALAASRPHRPFAIFFSTGALAIVFSIGLNALIVLLLMSGRNGPGITEASHRDGFGPIRRVVVLDTDTFAPPGPGRGATLLPFDMLTVPSPPPPGSAPPAAKPRVVHAPPATATDKAARDWRAAHVPPATQPAQQPGWFQRFFKTGTQAPGSRDSIHGESATSAASAGGGGAGAGGGSGGGSGGGGGGGGGGGSGR